MRTGILGGTFDPIHIGHLHAGEIALHQAKLDRILFMPAGDPWQKADRTVSSAEHRVRMTRLAVEGIDGFQVDDREITRGGPTYTIDTLESFPVDEELFLILGADAAAGLPTWHRGAEVMERAMVLIVPRVGVDSTEVLEQVPEAMFLDMGILEVSGTEIRSRAGAGEPFRFLVPKPVHAYIGENDLYQQGGGGDMVEASSEVEESS